MVDVRAAQKPPDSICVCSNEAASKGNSDDTQENIDLALPATTEVGKMVERLRAKNSATGLQVVFATHQSLAKMQPRRKNEQEKKKRGIRGGEVLRGSGGREA